uniref:Uncharacterized protein n=1 Tax=Salix viminalis TaxID=40686 RepID=A0A6N2NAA4_SALVM
MSFGVLRKEHYLSPNFAPPSLAPYWLSLFCGIDFAAENWLTKASIVEMKFLDWYVKISAGGALIGASMELFMIKTGFCMIR